VPPPPEPSLAPLDPNPEPEPQPRPYVFDIENREPDIVEGFAGEESLTGLRAKIWWQRHKCHLLIFVGLIIWVYLSCAWYCGGLTLSKCF
jgi:hypothetical protein